MLGTPCSQDIGNTWTHLEHLQCLPEDKATRGDPCRETLTFPPHLGPPFRIRDSMIYYEMWVVVVKGRGCSERQGEKIFNIEEGAGLCQLRGQVCFFRLDLRWRLTHPWCQWAPWTEKRFLRFFSVDQPMPCLHFSRTPRRPTFLRQEFISSWMY